MRCDSVEVPPFLEARIRNQHPHGEAVAAMASAAGAGNRCRSRCFRDWSWPTSSVILRLTVRSQESYIGSVSTQIATLMRVGLGDHIHCSVFRKYPKNPPTTEEFIEKMTPQYAGLIPIVRSQVPDSYRMMLAHQCSYHRRKFVHLSLMSDSNMLSLVITRKARRRIVQHGRYAASAGPGGNSDVPVQRAALSNDRI